MEKEDAAGKRFFITAGNFSNAEMVRLIGKNFPEYKNILPFGEALKPGEYPDGGHYGYDNRRSREELGLTYRGFEGSVIDTVKSLQPLLKT